MRFLTLVAHAFGPFRERTFEFAAGMTVVHGANEAGKSSLHAALQAGLCGVRRGRGSRTAPERDFVARHRPWTGESWCLRVRLALDGGRTVEIFQDLEGRASSRALDVDLGRDCTAEILNDGTPDGAVWLGLDRIAFPATACVRQAQVLAVRDHGAALQQFLQSAAANAGRDATAAAALERLNEFHREQVGQDRANSTKPLRRSLDLVRQAEAELEAAQSEHGTYLYLLEREGDLRQVHARTESHLAMLRAAHARETARTSRRRFERARTLASRHPQGRPVAWVDDDARAQAATRALRAWESRPEIVVLSGPTATELREELSRARVTVGLVTVSAASGSLTAVAEGPRSHEETQPAPALEAAFQRFKDASQSLERHRGGRPPEKSSPGTNGASIEELREIVRDLASPEPVIDATLIERWKDLERAHTTRRVRGRVLASAAIAAIAIAAMLYLVRASAVAVGSSTLVALGFVTLLLRHLRAAAAMREATRHAATALAAEELKRTVWRDATAAAIERAAQFDLPAEVAVLRTLVQRSEEYEKDTWRLAEWKRQLEILQVEEEGSAAALAGLLRARSIPLTGDLRADYEAYASACAARARLAVLQDEIDRREREEKAAAQVVEQRAAVDAELRDAARSCGIKAGDFAAMQAGLRTWLASRSQKLAVHQAAVEEWTELETLLAGRSLHDVEAECTAAETWAAALVAALAPGIEIPPAPSPEELASAEAVEREAGGDLARVQSEMEVRARAMQPVAEAEEQLSLARAELQRIQRLDSTLQTTRTFLEKAQERVHRTIAPILATTLQTWLPEVTGGRYTAALVDPDSLAVQVQAQDGDWRAADLLSHGTAEQVYLLLRAAMAKHLAGRRESCPLILDDVTVHCDAARKAAILQTLHVLSRERQVIVFTQEDAVLAWAEMHCVAPADRVLQLSTS